MRGRGLFVSGTDTGVGKTTFSIGLVAALSARGLRVAAMKPCETGDGDDADRLRAATGSALDRALSNPYRFPLPAAPEVAARRAHAHIDLRRVVAAYRALAADADWTIVEGAGGLLVPLTPRHTVADLIARLALPLVLVARTRLGTINHTLMSAEIARARGLRLVGVVFSRTERRAGPEERETIDTIVRHGKLRSFGVLPFLRTRTPRALHAALQQNVELDALLRAIDRT